MKDWQKSNLEKHEKTTKCQKTTKKPTNFYQKSTNFQLLFCDLKVEFPIHIILITLPEV